MPPPAAVRAERAAAGAASAASPRHQTLHARAAQRARQQRIRCASCCASRQPHRRASGAPAANCTLEPRRQSSRSSSTLPRAASPAASNQCLRRQRHREPWWRSRRRPRATRERESAARRGRRWAQQPSQARRRARRAPSQKRRDRRHQVQRRASVVAERVARAGQLALQPVVPGRDERGGQAARREVAEAGQLAEPARRLAMRLTAASDIGTAPARAARCRVHARRAAAPRSAPCGLRRRTPAARGRATTPGSTRTRSNRRSSAHGPSKT